MKRNEKILECMINILNNNLEIDDLSFKNTLNAKIQVLETERIELLNLLNSGNYWDVEKKNGTIYYKLIDPNLKQKINLLEDLDKKIFKYIENSGKKGQIKKDIKTHFNLHINVLDKSLRHLEKSGIIISYKTKEKNKKIYLKAGIDPDQNIIGNNFYQNGELDKNFLDSLKKTIKKILIKKEEMELEQILNYLKREKDYEFLNEKEIKLVLNIMLLEEEIENYNYFGKKVFKINKIFEENDLVKAIDIPCYNCKYFDVCNTNTEISPENCKYYDW